MRKEGIRKKKASVTKTTRGRSNLNMRFGEEIEGADVALHCIICITMHMLPCLKGVFCVASL